MLLTSGLPQLPRSGSALPLSMVQPGNDQSTGALRASIQDERGTAQGRQGYADLGSINQPPQAFGRPSQFVDSPTLFPTSTPAYDHTSPALRGESLGQPVLGMHSPNQGESQTLSPYSGTPQVQQAQFSQYAQPTTHLTAQNLHAQQGHHQPYHHHQQQYYGHHYSTAGQQAFQHPSDQIGLPISNEMMNSFGSNHPQSAYGQQNPHASMHAQSSMEPQRKGKSIDNAEPHTPRPPNAWILYRSQKFREIQQDRDSQSRSGNAEKPKSQAEISKMISAMWASETREVKDRYEAMADEKKLAHQRMYPTYRYRPKKKTKPLKTGSSSQSSSEQQRSGEVATKREAYTPDPFDRFPSADGYIAERRGHSELQRPSSSQNVSSIFDLGGREMLSRRALIQDRREPFTYGRQVSGSTTAGDSSLISSYGSNRMHPYGDRSSSLMRYEGLRSSDTSLGAYSSSHWSEADGVSGPSSGAYFDRSGSAYAGLGSTRMPSSLMNPGSVGSSSLLSFSPTAPRQSVPSQQLQQPIGPIDGALNLNELGAGGASTYPSGTSNYRTTPVQTHSARFGAGAATFGESRPEMTASGLAVAGSSNDALPEPFDPHRQL